MKYYVAISKDEAYVMNKQEWESFSQTHKGFHAKRYDSIEDAEKEVKKTKNNILMREAARPVNTKYLCFYDSEFNACDYNDGKIQEVIAIGMVIVDKSWNYVDEFYSLVRLKKAKEITARCKKITGLTNEEVMNAPAFFKVCNDVSDFIAKYKIGTIYALGKDDQKQFKETAELYRQTPAMKKIGEKLVNIRNDLKRLVGLRVGELGLQALKRICGLSGPVAHNALQDAKDLAEVYHVLSTVGYSESEYKALLKERSDRALYDRARNVTEDETMEAPKEIVQAKDALVAFISSGNSKLQPMIIQAIIDDLNTLIQGESS
jgi:inhibitor of KinA sporulation pathway (predicted exonuclease)